MQSNQHASSMAVKGRLIARGLMLSAIGVLCLPLALLAHAHLRRSAPSADEQLATPPIAIRLWFSERPELAFTRIELLGPDSASVALGAVVLMPDDPTGVSAAIPGPLPNGAYLVRWQAGGADGHPTRGSYRFVVAAPAAAPVASATLDTMRAKPGQSGDHPIARLDRDTQTPMKWTAQAATRWLEFIALLSVLGVLVFRGVVLRNVAHVHEVAVGPPASEGIADAARRFGQGALVLAFVAALARGYQETLAIVGPGVLGAVQLLLFGTSWGAGWLLGMGGVIVAATGFAIARRAPVGWTVAAVGALAMSIAPGLTGHAVATTPVSLAVLSDVVHVLGAGAWLGTLLVVILVAIPATRATSPSSAVQSAAAEALVRAFHPVALACASAVILSGFISAWLRLHRFSALWQTDYGNMLWRKLFFVVVVAVLGATNWRRISARTGSADLAHRIRRSASGELLFAAVVLALTGFLVSMPTPDETAPAAITRPAP